MNIFWKEIVLETWNLMIWLEFNKHETETQIELEKNKHVIGKQRKSQNKQEKSQPDAKTFPNIPSQ